MSIFVELPQAGGWDDIRDALDPIAWRDVDREALEETPQLVDILGVRAEAV